MNRALERFAFLSDQTLKAMSPEIRNLAFLMVVETDPRRYIEVENHCLAEGYEIRRLGDYDADGDSGNDGE